MKARLRRSCGGMLFVGCLAFAVVESSPAAEAATNPFSSQLPKPKAKAVKKAASSPKPKRSSSKPAKKGGGPPMPQLLDILRTSEGRFAVLSLKGESHLLPEGARVGVFRVALIGKRQVQLEPLSGTSGAKPKVLVLKSR